ncbi:MAG TPA: flagellar hook-associated protein FlgK [Solirubrobacteraceae bacterium]|nr:flagellar hook-associated protein FlgK [Solirubrobacteraceae bacterium]
MAVSTFMGIQTMLRGLLAQQRALDVTNHNVANANTVGYTRQEAVLGTTQPLAIPAGALNGTGSLLGTGVDVMSYQRVRDQFLDLQYRAQNMSLGEKSARSNSLQHVELALAEPGSNGVAAALERFWGAFGDLSNAPENPAARQAVVDKARALADNINQLQTGLSAAVTQAGAEFSALTASGGDIHRMAADLAGTMNAIRDAELTGAQPNDLYDRRDLLLDKLSEMGQVSVTASPAGGTDVALGGVTIVESDDTTGVARVPAGAFPMTFTSSPGGRLGALSDLASPTGPLAAYQQSLDRVAQMIAGTSAGTGVTTVNDIYQRDNPGTPLFTYGIGPAGTPVLALNPAITAATLSAGPGGPGANQTALDIAALRGGAIDKEYAQMVTAIGSAVADSKRQEATAQVLTDNLKDRRESVSGVSLDEEMTNLIRFQRAYQASARAMNTTDDMLDTLINRTGRVGL